MAACPGPRLAAVGQGPPPPPGFLALAPEVPVHTEVVPFPLEEANQALKALRGGEIRGAAVLVVD